MSDVDNPEEFRCLSLCTGYAGLELGLKRAVPALRTICYVEVEAFACANLVSKIEKGELDAAPIWTDIKTFDGRPFYKRVHIITAGYPCQPFSVAGKRQGESDPRYLWPHIERIIKTVRPIWCFFENVDRHLEWGYTEVYRSLRCLGYKVEPGFFSASEVCAPHRRKRLFIIANTDSSRCNLGFFPDRQYEIPPDPFWNTTQNIRSWFGWERWLNEVRENSNGIITKADFYGMDDGTAEDVDRIRLLGNGVVPQQAELAFRELMKLF